MQPITCERSLSGGEIGIWLREAFIILINIAEKRVHIYFRHQDLARKIKTYRVQSIS
ncbi:MAG: hypothetical protein ACI97N_000317 [Cognaticolwellia sp.]|jgi:hypothetical protein|tara:strand:- start:528 stop:698 length:171 start_codon:yes stop_codon:yes gene_type:complete